jgi:hypothetical protein
MKLRARWSGPPPRAGDYLASPTRPRFAYRVRAVNNVDSCVRWDPAQKAELRRLAIEVDRVPITQLPKASRVHPWRWDKRASRRDLTH